MDSKEVIKGEISSEDEIESEDTDAIFDGLTSMED